MSFRILITGAHGLVGRNLADKLNSEYELITPTRSQLDLRNFQQIVAFLNEYQPELIIHCAGKVGGIAANMKEPVSFLVENLDMGRNIILAARECEIKKLINLGSSCMYPRNIDYSLKERMVLTGELEPTNEGYALAKIVSQRLCAYISKENPEYRYKTIIPCNIYGRYDHFDPLRSHMIPAIIRKINDAMNKGLPSVEIWGSGNARREFMYAGDLADCILYFIKNYDRSPDLMNAGLGYDYTVNEYYSITANVLGYNGVFTNDLSKPEGMKRKLVDTSVAESFGWKASTTIEDGIRQTYEYFKTILN